LIQSSYLQLTFILSSAHPPLAQLSETKAIWEAFKQTRERDTLFAHSSIRKVVADDAGTLRYVLALMMKKRLWKERTP